MAALRSWLALALLVVLVRCQTVPEEEEEEVSFTERVPASWLRPVPPLEGEEEEEVGFTERVPAEWLRPALFPPEGEAEPLVRDGSSSATNTQKTNTVSPSGGDIQRRSTLSSGVSGEGEASTVPQQATTPSSDPQPSTTLSSSDPQPSTTPSSGGDEEVTRAVPDSWQPELPPPEAEEEEEGEEDELEFRRPPATASQGTDLWVTPHRIATMQAQEITTDTVLADYGKFRIADGVTVEFASPNYPDKYPDFVWNTWEFLADHDASILHLSCDVIELGGGDHLMVRSEAGGRQTFYDHSPTIETSAAGRMVAEFRSDLQGRGRLHCSVRAAAAAPGGSTERAGLQRVDLNYAACGRTKFNRRIIGGSDAPPHAFPWLVALVKRSSGTQFCGGSIINERFIVTAAHCVDRRRPGGLSVAVAKHRRSKDPNERIFRVKRITMHQGYNRNTQDRDIAIIELQQSLRSMIADKRGWVRPICLPKKSCRSANNCYTSRLALLAGWGLVNATYYDVPDTVQYVNVPVLTNTKCQRDYAKDRIGITDRMLCAGYPEGQRDTCQGDSGGPMAVVDAQDVYTLAGVVSFGKGCALPGYPGVYVRVSELLGWIREHSRL